MSTIKIVCKACGKELASATGNEAEYDPCNADTKTKCKSNVVNVLKDGAKVQEAMASLKPGRKNKMVIE